MLNGCSVVRCEETTLVLRNCTAATVSAFLSDRTGQIQAVPPASWWTAAPRGGLGGVSGNPPVPPQYEVDVSGAGGRVVFIQHNFDPARINSGGNFASCDHANDANPPHGIRLMKAPVRNFIIRDGAGTREAETLVLGRGLRITETAGGFPELGGVHGTRCCSRPPARTARRRSTMRWPRARTCGSGPAPSPSPTPWWWERRAASGSADPEQIAPRSPSRGPGIPAVLLVSGHCTVEGKLNVGTGSPGRRESGGLPVAGTHVVLRSIHIHRTSGRPPGKRHVRPSTGDQPHSNGSSPGERPGDISNRGACRRTSTGSLPGA